MCEKRLRHCISSTWGLSCPSFSRIIRARQFAPSFIKLAEERHSLAPALVAANRAACFRVPEMDAWQTTVRRKIPDELDAFDDLIENIGER